MGLSISGITIMQVLWMQKTIKLNEENFDRAVNESLASVVDKLEKEQVLHFMVPERSEFWNQSGAKVEVNVDNRNPRQQHFDQNIISKNEGARSYTYTYSSGHDRIRNRIGVETKENVIDSLQTEDTPFADSLFSNDDSRNFESPFKVIKAPKGFNIRWESPDSISSNIKVIQNDSTYRIIVISDDHVDTISPAAKSIYNIPPPPPVPDYSVSHRGNRNGRIEERATARASIRARNGVNRIVTGSHQRLNEEVFALSKKELADQSRKQQEALKQLVYEMDARKVELKDRVDFKELQILLGLEFQNKGLKSDFEFALATKDSVRKEVFSTPKFKNLPANSTYSTRLFPNNFVPLNDFLEVKFPNRSSAIYKSIVFPMSASLFFTLIVFLTFTLTLVTILKQKKLAEMKADFINNMTHELKTPIATISLASDSIDNPKVVDKPETVKYFTAIIREENSRMNKLVESVLQTARLERKTIKLNLKEVNLSEITEKVVDQIQIQAKAKEGSIILNKPNEGIVLFADENLMENVIFNLLDNALKYSSVKPEVIVTLKKLPGGIALSVQDNGIGISRSEQQRVFEKFYRISQGDVHNIKGFGLGLSNVKEITELHGGMVQLRSEIGNGSTFTLFFPNKVNGNE